MPRSDLVLFVTSADRPFTETERAFLEQVRGWGKKVVIVINKIDILESAAEVDEVRAFVADNARTLLGFSPEIFPVSARLALRAKQGDPARVGGEPLRGARALHRDDARCAGPDAPQAAESARRRRRAHRPARDRSSASASALLKDDFATLEEVERQLRSTRRT